MDSLGFKQSNTLTDIRLAIGFTACAIAGATFYYDYTLGWEKTKQYTLYTVIAYFILNSLLTWWIWWIEGTKVYIGERNGVKVPYLCVMF
jgi:signal peptidase complex subunit 2